MSFQISINKTKQSRINQFNPDKIEFGKLFTDHMVVCDYKDGKWGNPEIVPFGDISIPPGLSALHYGQSIFEGLKAFKSQTGEVAVFRAEQNAKRFNKSAHRMAMPELPEELFIQCVHALVDLDRAWISSAEGASLYIRPFMFATDWTLGIKVSETYKFMIYGCPAGSYYAHPVKVYIDKYHVRSVRGGVGTAKCAGNYAASLYPAKVAKDKGFDQNLWIDAVELKYLEETGTSNVFLRKGKTIYTPALSDSILAGITRDSVIRLLKDMGYEVVEGRISIDDLINWHKEGTLDEMFVTGTAVSVANIQLVGIDNEIYKLDMSKELVAEKVKTELNKIRTMQIPDKYGWVKIVKPNQTLKIS